MKNRTPTFDYLKRSKARLVALRTLMAEESFADVTREAQEIVELCPKGILRHYGIEPARIHDVSEQLTSLLEVIDKQLVEDIKCVIKASRELRRDRELAFYGGEDLTPGEFYKKEDAQLAISYAEKSVFVFGEIIEK